MKNLVFSSLLIAGLLSVCGQSDRSVILHDPEAFIQNQDKTPTATVKSATRLFMQRDDLTSVIELIPAGSVVSVLGNDSAYYHVEFNGNEGYIYRTHAELDKTPVTYNEMQQAQTTTQAQTEEQIRSGSRYDALVTKYGTSMADRIYDGKIWKGMNSGMVKDSWGTPEKINRVVNGDAIEEEWIYRSTWLYFKNNTLVQWGPAKK